MSRLGRWAAKNVTTSIDNKSRKKIVRLVEYLPDYFKFYRYAF